jgi:hypothetical protein
MVLVWKDQLSVDDTVLYYTNAVRVSKIAIEATRLNDKYVDGTCTAVKFMYSTIFLHTVYCSSLRNISSNY